MTTKSTTATAQVPTGRYAPGSVLSVTPYHASMIVNVDGENQTFAVFGWATVVDHYDDNGDARTTIEAVVRIGPRYYTGHDLRQKYGPDAVVNIH